MIQKTLANTRDNGHIAPPAPSTAPPFDVEAFVSEMTACGMKLQLRLHQRYSIMVSPRNKITPTMASTIEENRWDLVDFLSAPERHSLSDRVDDCMRMLNYLDHEIEDIAESAANNHHHFRKVRHWLGEVYEELFAIADSAEPLRRKKVG